MLVVLKTEKLKKQKFAQCPLCKLLCCYSTFVYALVKKIAGKILRIMFIGEYQHNLDDKGRVAVPIKFRAMLKKGAVVTKGLDNCLFLYQRDEWKKIAAKLANMPFEQANARALARHMLGGAMEVEFDNQGRITLPEYLRTFAGLKKKAVIAGLYNRLEIWDGESWDKFKLNTEKESNQIAEALSGIGL